MYLCVTTAKELVLGSGKPSQGGIIVTDKTNQNFAVTAIFCNLLSADKIENQGPG